MQRKKLLKSAKQQIIEKQRGDHNGEEHVKMGKRGGNSDFNKKTTESEVNSKTSWGRQKTKTQKLQKLGGKGKRQKKTDSRMRTGLVI